MAYFVKWQIDCCDEFDVTGSKVISKKKYDKFQKLLDKANKDDDFCELYVAIGNFDIYFYDAEDIRCDILFKRISLQEKATMHRLFGERCHGEDVFDSVFKTLKDRYEK